MGDRPPEIDLLDAQFCLKHLGDVVILGWRHEADFGGDQEKLSMSIIQGNNPVIDAVVDTGGDAGSIAEQLFRFVGGDIYFNDGGSESRGGEGLTGQAGF